MRTWPLAGPTGAPLQQRLGELDHVVAASVRPPGPDHLIHHRQIRTHVQLDRPCSAVSLQHSVTAATPGPMLARLSPSSKLARRMLVSLAGKVQGAATECWHCAARKAMPPGAGPDQRLFDGGAVRQVDARHPPGYGQPCAAPPTSHNITCLFKNKTAKPPCHPLFRRAVRLSRNLKTAQQPGLSVRALLEQSCRSGVPGGAGRGVDRSRRTWGSPAL